MDYYVIRVRNHLDAHWATWFEGLALVHEANGESVLSGAVADQAALHGLLGRIRDLNLTLISVQRVASPPGGLP